MSGEQMVNIYHNLQPLLVKRIQVSQAQHPRSISINLPAWDVTHWDAQSICSIRTARQTIEDFMHHAISTDLGRSELIDPRSIAAIGLEDYILKMMYEWESSCVLKDSSPL